MSGYRWGWATKGPFERDRDWYAGRNAGFVIGLVFGVALAGIFVASVWPPYQRYAVEAK